MIPLMMTQTSTRGRISDLMAACSVMPIHKNRTLLALRSSALDASFDRFKIIYKSDQVIELIELCLKFPSLCEVAERVDLCNSGW